MANIERAVKPGLSFKRIGQAVIVGPLRRSILEWWTGPSKKPKEEFPNSISGEQLERVVLLERINEQRIRDAFLP